LPAFTKLISSFFVGPVSVTYRFPDLSHAIPRGLLCPYEKTGEFENGLSSGIEPGGIVFYSGDKLEIGSEMIMASMKPENLDELKINEKEVEYQKTILSGLGRIRDIAQGPDGYLYIITSNTDGKAFPDTDDDKLVRILK